MGIVAGDSIPYAIIVSPWMLTSLADLPFWGTADPDYFSIKGGGPTHPTSLSRTVSEPTVLKSHHERTSGGLTPESAVAKLHTFVKEDLHQSVSALFTAIKTVV